MAYMRINRGYVGSFVTIDKTMLKNAIRDRIEEYLNSDAEATWGSKKAVPRFVLNKDVAWGMARAVTVGIEDVIIKMEPGERMRVGNIIFAKMIQPRLNKEIFNEGDEITDENSHPALYETIFWHPKALARMKKTCTAEEYNDYIKKIKAMPRRTYIAGVLKRRKENYGY